MSDTRTGVRRCRPNPHADSLDEELARRLNDWLAGSEQDSDHARTVAPIMGEILGWTILAVLGACLAML